jgi:CheY-like chemotaxis protein
VFNTKRSLRTSQDVHSITVAIDGRDALDRLRSGAFNGKRVVVLTDLSMPRMSGLELVSAMREEPTLRELPVVIVTNSNEEADRNAARELDVADYIVKSSGSRHFEQMLAWLRNYARPASPGAA